MKKIIGFLLIALFACNAQAEITAPKNCKAGEIAVITSDAKATWAVYPLEYKTSFYISDDGKTLCFASPKEGNVTFIAATVKDSNAVISTHTLYNGVDVPSDKEESKQADTEPTVKTLESVIKSGCKDKTEAQLTALAESFEEVVSGIERGTIRTPLGARETFRALFSLKTAKLDGKPLIEMEPLILEMSDYIDNTSIDSIKSDYKKSAEHIRTNIPKNDSKPKETKQAPPASSCPNGKCPTGNCPNGNCYRWGYY